MTPAETQRAVNLLVRDTLVKAGWTLTRDNEAGGALVLVGDGIQIVGGFHAYPEPVPSTRPTLCTVCLKEIKGEMVTTPSGATIHPNPEDLPYGWCPGTTPPLAAELDEKVRLYAIENEVGLWWTDETGVASWQDDLDMGGVTFYEAHEANFPLVGEAFHGAKWVEIYEHEVEGFRTTQECPGAQACQGCQDILSEIGWTVTDNKDVEVGQQTPVLGRFLTHDEAAEYIGTLPEAETGRYNLDGPSEEGL